MRSGSCWTTTPGSILTTPTAADVRSRTFPSPSPAWRTIRSARGQGLHHVDAARCGARPAANQLRDEDDNDVPGLFAGINVYGLADDPFLETPEEKSIRFVPLTAFMSSTPSAPPDVPPRQAAGRSRPRGRRGGAFLRQR